PSASASSSTRGSPRRLIAVSNERRAAGRVSSVGSSRTLSGYSEPGASEPTESADRGGQRLDGDERALLDRLHDELCDAVTALHAIARVRIGVDEQHLDLVSVAGIDQPRRVETGDAVTQRQPTARLYEGGVTVRKRDRDAGRHEGSSSARFEVGILPRDEV